MTKVAFATAAEKEKMKKLAESGTRRFCSFRGREFASAVPVGLAGAIIVTDFTMFNAFLVETQVGVELHHTKGLTHVNLVGFHVKGLSDLLHLIFFTIGWVAVLRSVQRNANVIIHALEMGVQRTFSLREGIGMLLSPDRNNDRNHCQEGEDNRDLHSSSYLSMEGRR